MTLNDEHRKTLQVADATVSEAKALYDNARLMREREIRRIAAEGGTYREIAAAAGVAYQRVAQIVTSKEAATRAEFDYLDFACSRCGAVPGVPCEGRTRWSAHAERHDAALRAFMEQHPEIG